MTMTDDERREYDQKLEGVKHSLKRFINLNISEIRATSEKDMVHLKSEFSEIKDIVNKTYYQTVDSHAEIEVLKTKYEFLANIICELRANEGANRENLSGYQKKMKVYELMVDHKWKVLLSIPILVGFYQALKTPIQEYFKQLIEIWK